MKFKKVKVPLFAILISLVCIFFYTEISAKSICLLLQYTKSKISNRVNVDTQQNIGIEKENTSPSLLKQLKDGAVNFLEKTKSSPFYNFVNDILP